MIPVALPLSPALADLPAARSEEVASPEPLLPSLKPNLLGNGLPAGLLVYEAACDVCGVLALWRSTIYTFTPERRLRLTVSDSSSNVCHAVCDCPHDEAPLTEIGVWLRNGQPQPAEELAA